MPINNRAPLLASDAPADRLGHIIHDSEGQPTSQLVQLWASATVRPLFLTTQMRGMSPTYAETASGLAAESIKPSRMTPGTNPAGRTPLGVRTGGAARGTNEPPPAFTGIAHFWAVTSTSLCCPAWAGGTQPAAFSIITLEHPLPAEKMNTSAGCL